MEDLEHTSIDTRFNAETVNIVNTHVRRWKFHLLGRDGIDGRSSR